MKFLLDQSTDARLTPYLTQLGHNVTRIGTDHPQGLPDEEIIAIARQEERILITDDRDFGELIFRLGVQHTGVIFLRLGSYAPLPTKIERLTYVLTRYAGRLDQFIVVTERRVRVRRTQPYQANRT